MSGHFGPACFDDQDDDPRPFRRGEMKHFKKQINDHARKKGYTEQAKKEFRAGNAPARDKDGNVIKRR